MSKEHKIIENPFLMHAVSFVTVLVLVAIAWGAQSADVDAIKEKANATNIRVEKIESRVRGNSEKLSRVDERTKLILDMVREINRKVKE